MRTEVGAVPAASLLTAPTADASPTEGVLIGLLLSQGLYYAFRHLAIAWLLADRDAVGEKEFWEQSFVGLATLQSLQTAALVGGGMVAAAGRKHGLVLGAALGVLNALLLLGLQHAVHQPGDEFTWYGQPVLQAFAGAIGD